MKKNRNKEMKEKKRNVLKKRNEKDKRMKGERKRLLR